MKLRVVESLNTILKEKGLHIILDKNEKEYEASGLFFKWNECDDEQIINTLYEENLSNTANAEQLVDKIIELEKKYGMKVYESSRNNMLHWQYVQGVTDEMFLSGKKIN